MQLDNISYQKLIDMGFERNDMGDDVLFRECGYPGFCLTMEFPLINIGISTPCKAQTHDHKWDFNIHYIDSADVIRKVKLIELTNLIEFFALKSNEVESVTKDLKEVLP